MFFYLKKKRNINLLHGTIMSLQKYGESPIEDLIFKPV